MGPSGAVHYVMNFKQYCPANVYVFWIQCCYSKQAKEYYRACLKDSDIWIFYLQNKIGADIIMALDDVVKTTTTGPRVEEAMYRTLRWIDRCIAGLFRIILPLNWHAIFFSKLFTIIFIQGRWIAVDLHSDGSYTDCGMMLGIQYHWLYGITISSMFVYPIFLWFI